MGAYSKVVSVLRQIDTAHTFIGGTRADITSAWTFVDGERRQVFPSSDFYTQVYAKTDPGSYSETLSYGRYKIVISGGGGSGGADAYGETNGVTRWANPGDSGEEITVMLDVPYGETKTISGIIAQGGQPSKARGKQNDTSSQYATAGAGGTGYDNGKKGGAKYFPSTSGMIYVNDSFGVAGGAGGGSSSISIDGGTVQVAKGGNGGNARIKYTNYFDYPVSGGAGGSGGTTTGTGAAGGAKGHKWDGTATSGAGTDGYIKVYQSSIFPD